MTLTIQDLGALGEFFGSIAVLVTLVYLAFQTRQNTMAIAAQLDAARLDSVGNLNLAVATSTELEEALNEDLIEPMATSNEIAEAMDEDRVVDVPPNQVRRALVWGSLMNSIQCQHHQSREGHLGSLVVGGR